MKKKLSTFNVLCESTTGRIEFVNFFEFGQWQTIKKILKKSKKQIEKIERNDLFSGSPHFTRLIEDYLKFCSANMLAITKKDIEKSIKDSDVDCFKKLTLDKILRRETMYYFWSKCEYEVLVKSWPCEKDSLKVDVFKQLNANWEVFRDIVFKEIGLL